MKQSKVLDIIIFLLVLLFLYAATSKLIEYDLFKAQISKSPLITDLSSWISILIPALEIIISILLILPKYQLFALHASFSIMFLFTIYVAFILTFSPYIPCSCGGILSQMGWTEHLIFNIIFTALPVVGIILKTKEHHNITKEKNTSTIRLTDVKQYN